MWTSAVINNTHIVHEYMASSMLRDSEQMRRIQAAVKKAGIFVVLGYSKREDDTIYGTHGTIFYPLKEKSCTIVARSNLRTSNVLYEERAKPSLLKA